MIRRFLHNLDKVIISLMFCALVYIPFVTSIIEDDKLASGIEKRNLNTLPDLPSSLETLSQYPEKINSYYTDHFGYREELTKAYFKLVNKYSSKSSTEDVTIGKDGWLFLGSIKPGYQSYNDPIGDVINTNLYTQKELENFAKTISKIKTWLNQQGIEYLYVITPNKHTIYFENMPEYIVKKNDKSATDQLVAYLKQHTDVDILDLRPALFEEKKQHQIYFKTDSHWNHYATNVAQFEIMKKVQSYFPDKVKPFLLNNKQFNITQKGGGDLAKLAKIENIIEADPHPIFDSQCLPINETKNTNISDTHTLVCKEKTLNSLIFRDSYFLALQPYIARQFHRSTYIWERINYHLLRKYVKQEKPDIVIEEVIERSLPYMSTFSSD